MAAVANRLAADRRAHPDDRQPSRAGAFWRRAARLDLYARPCGGRRLRAGEDQVTVPPRRLDVPWLRKGSLARVLAVLDRDGEEARVVGGAVRNALLDEPLGDHDIATTALPAEVVRRAAAAGFKPVPTGIEHGTVTVVTDGRPFEVTTLRE